MATNPQSNTPERITWKQSAPAGKGTEPRTIMRHGTVVRRQGIDVWVKPDDAAACLIFMGDPPRSIQPADHSSKKLAPKKSLSPLRGGKVLNRIREGIRSRGH